MGRKKSQWFLAEATGHLLCVEGKSLLVSDFSTVSVNDRVQFKYGAQTLLGEILFIGDTESEVVQKMELLRKEKKSKPTETFVAGQPRNAKLNALKLVASSPKVSIQTSKTPKVIKQVRSKDLKKKRLSAAHTLEDETADAVVPPMQQVQSQVVTLHGSDSDSDSESEMSDAAKKTSEDKKKGHSKDLKEIDNLNNSDSDGTEVFNIPVQNDQEMNLFMKESEKIKKKENGTRASNLEEPSRKRESNSDSDMDMNKSNSKKRKPSGIESSESDQEKESSANTKKSGSEAKVDRERTPDTENQEVPLKQKKKSAEIDGGKVSKVPKKSSELDGSTAGSIETPKNSVNGTPSETPKDSPASTSKSSETPKNSPASTPRNKSKKKKSKRNLTIYPGINYRYCETSKNTMKLDENYDVYISTPVYEKAIQAKTTTICLGMMADDIYTEEAILNASAFGFPPRGKGKAALQNVDVLPRLHPDGFEAIKAVIFKLQVNNKLWRPKATNKLLTDAFVSRVCRAKKKAAESSDEDGDDEDEEGGE